MYVMVSVPEIRVPGLGTQRRKFRSDRLNNKIPFWKRVFERFQNVARWVSHPEFLQSSFSGSRRLTGGRNGSIISL